MSISHNAPSLISHKFILTVDGKKCGERSTREEADATAKLWATSGRLVQVKTPAEYERETAPMIKPQPKGTQIDGWDV